MRGDHCKTTRMTVYQITVTKNYEECGIETCWGASKTLYRDPPRVQASDENCRLFWDLSMSMARHQSMRNLPITHGYPKRFTLVTSDRDSEGKLFLREFKEDLAIHADIQAQDGDWAEKRQRRSLFERATNKQVEAFCARTDWLLTPWLQIWA